jgi:hypothetical protein
MIVETTDPITGHAVRDLAHLPYVIDGVIKFTSSQKPASANTWI